MDQLREESGNGAIFSECRNYRYALWRIWDTSKPLVMFIGVNPSTASEIKPDPTITRIRSIVSNWGYGGFYMMNLFGIVSANPKILKTHPDPVGCNDGWLEKVAPKCSKIVFAWGDFKEAKARSIEVVKMFPNAEALFINKNGTPKHPLYCKNDIQPIPYNYEQGTL